MVAQQVIQHKIDSDDKSEFKFDPDGDGFDFNHEKALKLHNNMNLLQFIRRNLAIYGTSQKMGKQFDQGIDNLQKKLKDDEKRMPECWQPKKHDKGLLKAVSQKGFEHLKVIIGDEKYGFEDIKEEMIES